MTSVDPGRRRPIPFVALDEPRYGEVVEVAPLVRRVVAANPSKFTYTGTGTYLVGDREVAVIDPGPRLAAHQDALQAALAGRRVVAVLVTHCHADHSTLAPWLAEHAGAPTVAIGPHRTGGDDWPHEAWPSFPVPDDAPSTDADVASDEAYDLAFTPDRTVADDAVAAHGDGWTIRAVTTPGHASNHACYALDAAGTRSLFTGDHIMGWSTTVVSPPDGDMAQYLASLRRVIDGRYDTLYPTHGAAVTDPGPFLDAYLAHRLHREAQVLGAVADGLGTLAEMVPALYADVRPALHAAAARSVFAHLRQLTDDGRVGVEGGGPAHPAARYVSR